MTVSVSAQVMIFYFENVFYEILKNGWLAELN